MLISFQVALILLSLVLIISLKIIPATSTIGVAIDSAGAVDIAQLITPLVSLILNKFIPFGVVVAPSLSILLLLSLKSIKFDIIAIVVIIYISMYYYNCQIQLNK